MCFRDENKIRQENPEAVIAMRQYLEQIGLHPEDIATRKRPVAFIDLVLSGDTFGRLITFLFNWSNDIGYEWNAVSRRIRLVGITIRTKTSPNTWRWQQHADWIHLLKNGSVKNVSVSRDFWSYLGDYQPKVSRSYTSEHWGDSELSSPSYREDQLKALRLAFDLFELGRRKEKRLKFVSCLTEESAMKHVWFKSILMELRS